MSGKNKEIYEKRRMRNDAILVLAVLIAAAAVFFFYRLTAKNGDAVVVLADGEKRAVYPISEDIETVIETDGGVNTLVIRDGRVSISEADCPDGICVDHREISMSGETIVCLPHKLVIEITAVSDSDIIP